MRALMSVAFAAVCVLAAAGAAQAETFRKEYRLSPGGHVSVGNISGDVFVTGYDGDQVVVTAEITGRDADRVHVEDLSSGNSVDVKAKYPNHCNNCDVDVTFRVQVPRSTELEYDAISSVSGNVEISDVTGRVKANSISGDVRVKGVTGTVDANAISGDVTAEIERLQGNDGMDFSTISGNVHIVVPSDAGADVTFHTMSGDIADDFGLQVVEKKYGSGKSARGQIGDGSRRLEAKTISGDIELRRR